MSRPSSSSAATHGSRDDTPTRIEPTTDDGGPTTPGIAGPPRPSELESAPLRIGRYTVLRRLGQGGMGVVYAAYDDELDRRVAVKLLLSRPEEGSLGRARLLREAQALAKLSHPNVVQVYETGSHNDQVYLVMEYVEGATLRDWRADAAPSWAAIIDMYLETGKGLAAAHRAGLIHRDFKPVNVIVGDDGRPRILDFGLARAGALIPGNEQLHSSAAMPLRSVLLADGASTSLSAELTQAGTLLGTPAYMAPEQLFLTETDARADIYAFAVSLWEALYGARPYPAKTVDELRKQVQAGPPTPPKGRVPAAISRVLLRALAFDRDERFASMELLLRALEDAARLRRRLLVAAGVALLVATLLVIAYVVARADAEDPRAECADAEAMTTIWSPAIAGDVEASIAGVGLSYGAATFAAIAPRLNSYAEELSAAQIDACVDRRVHRGPLPPALREQAACLDRRRFELETVITQLRDADAKVVEHAVEAVTGLSPLARCADLEGLAADALRRSRGGYPEGGDDRWAAIEDQLVQARVAERAEQQGRAQALAEEALAAAEAIDARPLRAAALLRLGTVAEHRGAFDEARTYLEQAHLAAEAVGDDRLVADVAIELIRSYGITDIDERAARTWLLVAEGKLARIGEAPRQRIHLDLHRGIVALETGDRKGARAAVTAAVELAEQHRKALPSLYISALNILSAVQKGDAELRDAEATLRDAYARHVELFGEGHPYQAMLIYNIGAVQLMLSDLDDARRSFEEALAAREAAYGPDHPDVAQSLVGLAAVLSDLGEPDLAIPHLERALTIEERARGGDNPELIFPLYNLSEAQVGAGRLAEAEPPLRRALAILERRDLRETTQAVLILTGIAKLQILQERYDDALATLEEAIPRARRVYGEEHPSFADFDLHRARALEGKGELAAAEEAIDAGIAWIADKPDHIGTATELALTKASILWHDMGRRAAARELVKEAGAALRERAIDSPKLHESIDAWLAEHPG